MYVKQTELNRTVLRRTWLCLGGLTLGLVAMTGCHTDMWVQPKPQPQADSDFFADGVNSRDPIAHTVDRDHLKTDDAYWRGTKGIQMVNGKPAGAIFVDELPSAVLTAPEFVSPSGDQAETLAKILDRGQDRFNIYCSPCHSELGDGNGMIAKRGFSEKRPPGNYHTDRLRKMPLGHFYDVITNGFGVMTPRAFQVEPNDRWAIAAYIRVLQLSQNAQMSDVPPDKVSEIDKPAPTHEQETGSEAEPK